MHAFDRAGRRVRPAAHGFLYAAVPLLGPYGGLRTRIGLAVLVALIVIVAIAIWRRGRRG